MSARALISSLRAFLCAYKRLCGLRDEDVAQMEEEEAGAKGVVLGDEPLWLLLPSSLSLPDV